MAELGSLCAKLNKALEDFNPLGLDRTVQWDPLYRRVLNLHLPPVLFKTGHLISRSVDLVTRQRLRYTHVVEPPSGLSALGRGRAGHR